MLEKEGAVPVNYANKSKCAMLWGRWSWEAQENRDERPRGFPAAVGERRVSLGLGTAPPNPDTPILATFHISGVKPWRRWRLVVQSSMWQSIGKKLGSRNKQHVRLISFCRTLNAFYFLHQLSCMSRLFLSCIWVVYGYKMQNLCICKLACFL